MFVQPGVVARCSLTTKTINQRSPVMDLKAFTAKDSKFATQSLRYDAERKALVATNCFMVAFQPAGLGDESGMIPDAGADIDTAAGQLPANAVKGSEVGGKPFPPYRKITVSDPNTMLHFSTADLVLIADYARKSHCTSISLLASADPKADGSVAFALSNSDGQAKLVVVLRAMETNEATDLAVLSAVGRYVNNGEVQMAQRAPAEPISPSPSPNITPVASPTPAPTPPAPAATPAVNSDLAAGMDTENRKRLELATKSAAAIAAELEAGKASEASARLNRLQSILDKFGPARDQVSAALGIRELSERIDTMLAETPEQYVSRMVARAAGILDSGDALGAHRTAVAAKAVLSRRGLVADTSQLDAFARPTKA
jgi:hypothetical protein